MGPVYQLNAPPAKMSSLSSLSGASGKLLRRIHRACRPTLDEPNIALNLEICDLINSKQGSLPREACIAVVKLINSRDPQVSELALTLLDYLVKNCGYPVHLQISRKEFLNELVKRFPERPPPAYSRTQRLILGTLAEWVQTLCKTSRYKDDLTHIKDMYRLLRSKGYDFPAVKKEDAAVLNPSDNLKSIEELQQEERIAQSAKLHELIRRGRPQDLKEANDLMKIMSGFKEDETFAETKQIVYDDIDKLKRKITILNEMLDNASNTGVLNKDDDTLQELISTVKVSQPRVQKIIQEEGEHGDVQGLLELNDRINNTLLRAAQLKGEDTSKMPAATNSVKASVNLIDFDDDEPVSPNPNSPAPNTHDAINDLLGDLGGLSFDNSSSNNSNSQFGMGAINLLGSSTAASNNSPATAAVASTSPVKPASNLDILSGFSSASPAQTPSSQSPFPLAANKPVVTAKQPVSSEPDLFGFDFAATSQVTPSLNSFLKDENLTIEYVIIEEQPTLSLQFQFSNTSFNQLSNIQIYLAATKAFELTLDPPSSNTLYAKTLHGIKQNISIRSKSGEAFNTVKLKYKLNYNNNGSPTEKQDVVTINV